MDDKRTVTVEDLSADATGVGSLLSLLARRRGLWGQHLAGYPDEVVAAIKNRTQEIIGVTSVNADELLKLALEIESAEQLTTIIFAAQQLTDMVRGLTEIVEALDDIPLVRSKAA